MKKHDSLKGDAEEWIKKAEHDMATSEVNLDNNIFDAAAFFAHQAAEKALKALYILRYKRLWKVHDLVGLGKRIDVPQNILKACDALNPHYIETRYPIGIDYEKDAAAEALGNARKVVKWAKERMKK